MLRYEIKKVFSKSKNRIAVIVLFVVLAITSILILLLEFRLQDI